jgi:hypothetical protein
MQFKKEVEWLQAGCQRLAVTRSLYKPMTATELRDRARANGAKKIRLQDVWSVLKESKDLTYCLTPKLVTGRLYFLTGRGRAALMDGFKQRIADLPEDIDWTRYAKTVRGSVRRRVLQEIYSRCERRQSSTPSELRRKLTQRHPVSLTSIRRAIDTLKRLRLIRPVTHADNNRSKPYVLTAAGRRIAEEAAR